MKIKEDVRIKDLTGHPFERLTVLGIEEGSKGRITWRCLCTCGNVKTISGGNLRAGHTKSCGCLHKEQSTTHGMRNTPEYITWSHIIQRCTNPKDVRYKNYGGRGITVCKEWLNSFAVFFKDMGEKPKGLTIERIDNNKGYYKENCKWATYSEQSRNRRVRPCSISHVTGVTWDKRRKKWVATIGADYKIIFLGYFSNLEDATNAREEGERKYWNK